MDGDPRNILPDPVPVGIAERALLSGKAIRQRVQALIDEDPDLSGQTIVAPMPKPTATEDPTGCNWTMHYLGQFPGYEPAIDRIVATVQHEANIAGPTMARP